MAGLALVCFFTGPDWAAVHSVRATGLPSSVKALAASSGSGYRPAHRPARGKFLVAARSIRDPRFAETVILLIECGGSGAMGLVINRPTGVSLSAVLPEIKGLKRRDDILYFGGPVSRNQLFLLIRSQRRPKDAVHISGDIYASASLSELQRLIEDPSPGEKFHAYAGYAGWGAGQLDEEVSRGDWHVLQADGGSILDKKPSDVWPELIEQVSGIWV